MFIQSLKRPITIFDSESENNPATGGFYETRVLLASGVEAVTHIQEGPAGGMVRQLVPELVNVILSGLVTTDGKHVSFEGYDFPLEIKLRRELLDAEQTV